MPQCVSLEEPKHRVKESCLCTLWTKELPPSHEAVQSRDTEEAGCVGVAVGAQDRSDLIPPSRRSLPASLPGLVAGQGHQTIPMHVPIAGSI